MNFTELIETIRAAGITGLLVIALIGGWRRWWVFGWHYKEVARERDEWKKLALGGTHLAERSIQVAREIAVEADNVAP